MNFLAMKITRNSRIIKKIVNGTIEISSRDIDTALTFWTHESIGKIVDICKNDRILFKIFSPKEKTLMFKCP